uniref:Uncharacterized protein n=1 Tax=Chenopodium quinoa TaxID=63459 RepID=A0A803NEZ6_CHEQI
MCSATPPHGISSQNWIKLLKYWDSEKGKEDDHGEKMSLLAPWKKPHTSKDGSFLPGTVTEDFVDDAKDKVEELRLIYLSKSQQELEDEAFELTMHAWWRDP